MKALNKEQAQKNISIVKRWLKFNQRNKAFLARIADVDASVISVLMKGGYVSPPATVKLAKAIKAPLYGYCIMCGQVHKTNNNGGCSRSKK